MTGTGFFEENQVNTGAGAPSFKFQGVSSGVLGTIVDQFKTVVTDPKTGGAKLDKNGNEQAQLNVTLQTELRNWDKTTKPSVDKETGQPKPASEDDGKRRIYVKHRMIQAVAEALQKAGKPDLENGGTLGVKLIDHQDIGKMNPLPVYEAMYTAPAPKPAREGFFAGGDDSSGGPWATATQAEEPPF